LAEITHELPGESAVASPVEETTATTAAFLDVHITRTTRVREPFVRLKDDVSWDDSPTVSVNGVRFAACIEERRSLTLLYGAAGAREVASVQPATARMDAMMMIMPDR